MEIFWIVVGVVVIVLFVLSQNRTKVSNRTVITRNRTIQTEDGEIRVQQTQVVDSSSTQYTKPNTINQANHDLYDKTAIESYNANLTHKRAVEIEGRKARQEVPPVKIEKIINPPHAVSPATLPKQELLNASKKCTRCSRELDFSKFRKSSKHPDGHTIWCAHCLDGSKNTKHTKWCPICEVRRKRTSYDKNSNNADGLMSWCKSCCDRYL